MADIRKTRKKTHSEEVDFIEFFHFLWAGKWILAGSAFLVLVIAVLIAVWLPNQYRAEALLAPVTADQKSDLAAMASQFGGLASLAGIRLPDASANKVTLGLETLKSRKFVGEFVDRHDLMVPLMAIDRWNAGTREISVDEDIYDESTGKWVRDVDPPKLPEPSRQEAYESFIKLLSLGIDETSGFVRIAITHQSPDMAQQWVEWLVQDLNSTLREQDILLANQSLVYLREQLKQTSLSGMQEMLYRLVEEQTKTVMLAKLMPEYVFSTVDPAIVPEKPSAPNRVLICIIGLFAGLGLGLLILVIRRVNSGEKAVE